MAERFKALVLKINVLKDTVSSNLTLLNSFFMLSRYIKFINKKNFHKYLDRLCQNNSKRKKSEGIKKNRECILFKDKRGLASAYKRGKDITFILYIRSSLRGFHVNISNKRGKVLKMFSLGQLGFKKASRYNAFSLRALFKKILGSLKKLKKFSYLRRIPIFQSKLSPYTKISRSLYCKKVGAAGINSSLKEVFRVTKKSSLQWNRRNSRIIGFKLIKKVKKVKINIFLKGFGSKRNRLVRFFIRAHRIKKYIASIVDLSDLPYNGCRPKKLRRK
jgi:ribosomal protein S11